MPDDKRREYSHCSNDRRCSRLIAVRVLIQANRYPLGCCTLRATRTRLRPVSPNLDGSSELPMSLADNSTNCHLSSIRKHRRQLRSDWQGAGSPGGAPWGQNSSPPAVPQAEQACSALDRRARLV
ncbi:hypothetical protein T10_2400 [Trichinella papuae]|uniref:Uncharacterized protein n=1 Tax=Trichinella papuae TaxID=268474 RepID=A0A0V1MZ30_9BILA|nr:hypothetical protein T10_2400 [Trichinella papuae]